MINSCAKGGATRDVTDQRSVFCTFRPCRHGSDPTFRVLATELRCQNIFFYPTSDVGNPKFYTRTSCFCVYGTKNAVRPRVRSVLLIKPDFTLVFRDELSHDIITSQVFKIETPKCGKAILVENLINTGNKV